VEGGKDRQLPEKSKPADFAFQIEAFSALFSSQDPGLWPVHALSFMCKIATLSFFYAIVYPALQRKARVNTTA
jgi:hypothetical protein